MKLLLSLFNIKFVLINIIFIRAINKKLVSNYYKTAYKLTSWTPMTAHIKYDSVIYTYMYMKNIKSANSLKQVSISC